MKTKLIISLSMIAANTLTSFVAQAGEITGRQFIVLGKGPTPISDNEILVAPCAPVNKNCREVMNQFNASIEEGRLSRQKLHVVLDEYWACLKRKNYRNYQECNRVRDAASNLDDIRPMDDLFKKMNQIQSFRTDFEGKFRLDCPAQNCIIFSRGEVGYALATWMFFLPGTSKQDLMGSNAGFLMNNRPNF